MRCKDCVHVFGLLPKQPKCGLAWYAHINENKQGYAHINKYRIEAMHSISIKECLVHDGTECINYKENEPCLESTSKDSAIQS